MKKTLFATFLLANAAVMTCGLLGIGPYWLRVVGFVVLSTCVLACSLILLELRENLRTILKFQIHSVGLQQKEQVAEEEVQPSPRARR